MADREYKKWPGGNMSGDLAIAISKAVACGVRKEEATWLPMQDPEVSSMWDRQVAMQAKLPPGTNIDWPGDMPDPSDDEFMKLYDDDFMDKLYEQIGATPDDEKEGTDGTGQQPSGADR